MALQVIWSKRSRDELDGVLIAIRDENPSAAMRFAESLIRRVDQLRQSPRSGAVYTRRRGFEVRQIVFRKYRIFYRVRPRLQRVEILACWHGARQEPNLPGKQS